MSKYVEGSFRTFTAAADLPAHSIVKTNSNGALVAAAAGTDVILGVIHAAVKSGGVIDVRLRSASGTLSVKIGGTAVAKDAALTSDGSGLAVTTSTAGHQIVGYALKAGIAGEVIEILPSTGKF